MPAGNFGESLLQDEIVVLLYRMSAVIFNLSDKTFILTSNYVE